MNAFTWRAKRRKWLGYVPYAALLVIVVIPMTVIAGLLAARTGMFRLHGAPDPKQTSVFLTFIGGGLGTAATVLGMLFTWQHNRRERYRLGLDTVLKSLESLDPDTPPKVAGVLASMILLGQPRVALRVLAPAWKREEVDADTATWLIGQILAGDSEWRGSRDGDPVDQPAVIEAAVLLREHADELTKDKPGSYCFPGYFHDKWKTKPKLPGEAKEQLLIAMGTMLASRGKDWWECDGHPPMWPTEILELCARNDRDRTIRSAASVLFGELNLHFPDDFKSHFEDEPDVLDGILRTSREAATDPDLDEFTSLANRIREAWAPKFLAEAVE